MKVSPVQAQAQTVQVVQAPPTDLALILADMRRQGVEIGFRNGQPMVRGEADADLFDRMAAVKPHLLRLAASDALAEPKAGGAAWRVRLKKADDFVREAWALVAHGHEGQGMGRRAAEWLAWEDVAGE